MNEKTRALKDLEVRSTSRDRERCSRDINKLDAILAEFVGLGMHEKYANIYEWANNYANDARHFYDNGDYFTSFGCANYAYGFIDCILILEGKKKEEIKK